ncbi:MAG: AAA family ATPase, partial [Pirellulales bacterium]|nr:AAA family ATPase [Pirellulales bacterium]
MSNKLDELLAGLSAAQTGGSSETWQDLAASEPAHHRVAEQESPEDAQLEALVDRINDITSEPPVLEDAGAGRLPVHPNSTELPGADNPFVPTEPTSLAEAETTQSEVEALILKYLLARGEATGRQITDQIKMPFLMVESLMAQMKQDDLVGLKGAAAMNDFRYTLSEAGRQFAKRHTDHCTYFGSAPVSLNQYIASIEAQSLAGQHPTVDDLRRAFDDLLIDTSMLTRLGPAINSGRGLFLFGAPGNGKTSIAERVTKSFGEFIWIPRAVGVDGEIMRLFDPMNHEEVPLPPGDGLLRAGKIDQRWVRIRRPTIVVGGELTMDQLEVTLNTSTGINESPLQMKSNCGTLVIDD